tara:strand:+ start:1435 stop:9198 length:7764 start_codon:yes stop_codon:yes gene_type:complete
MNEEALLDAYTLFKSKGYNGSIEAFKVLIESNPDALNDSFTLFSEKGYNGDIESYKTLIGVKKKDEPQISGVIPESTEMEDPGMESPTPIPQTAGSSDSNIEVEDEIVEQSTQEVETPNQDVVTSQNNTMVVNLGGGSQQPLSQPVLKEKKTLLEQYAGENWFTDLAGDMWRAGVKGQAQGGSVDEALELYLKGGGATDEDIMEFIAAQKRLQTSGYTEEQAEYDRVYNESGGGLFGWLKGIASAPTVLPAMLVTSVSSMLTPAALTAAGTTIGTGTAIGAAGGATVGGVGAVPGAVGGAVAALPWAIMAASTTMETGLTLAELLQEEAKLRGLKFDKEGVRKILNDDEAMFDIRSKAIGRGLAIGAIDRLSFGLASSVTKKGLLTAASKPVTIAKAASIEAAGGSLGETAGMLVAGQELNVGEILNEGIVGTLGTPLSVGNAILKNKINPPVYKIKGESVTKEFMTKFITKGNVQDVAAADISIKNDPALKNLALNRRNNARSEAIVRKQLAEAGITDESKVNQLMDLEKKKTRLQGNSTRAGIRKLAEINKQIDDVLDGKAIDSSVDIDSKGNTVDDLVVVDRKYAIEVLNSEGVQNPTDEQIRIRQEQLLEKGKNIIDNENVEEGGLKPNGDLPNNKNRYETYTSDTMEVNLFVEDDQGQSSTNPTNDYRFGIRVNKKRSDNGNMQRVESLTKYFQTPEEAKAYGEKIILRDKPKTKIDASKKSSPVEETGKVESTVVEEVVEGVPNGIQQVTETNIKETETTNQESAPVQEAIVEESKDLESSINEDTNINVNEKTQVDDTVQETPSKQIENNISITETTEEVAPNYKSIEDQTTKVNKIIDLAKKGMKAVSKIIPDLNIVLHTSETEYNKSVSQKNANTRGAYNSNTNTININIGKANNRTVAHEIFHAVLFSKLGTNVKLQDVTKRMMRAVKKSIRQNMDLSSNQIQELENFISVYDSDVRNEEALSEVTGMLAENFTSLSKPTQSLVTRWINKVAKMLGIKTQSMLDADVIDLLNTISKKVSTGVEINETDVSSLDVDQEQGSAGQVGTFNFPDEKAQKAPQVSSDTRSFNSLIKEKSLKDFQGQKFITNMYDFTSAGITEIANGISLKLYGGKNYVPLMMQNKNLNLGEVSNLAAFNTKSQAEGFIRNSKESGAKLFAPHVGTKQGSWQFQQNIFEQLTFAALDNNILTNTALIKTFNEVLTSKNGQKAFNTFKKKFDRSKSGSIQTKRNIKNFNSFKDNPKELVELLDINNNYSPDLRKLLNDKLSANKAYQEALGVKNKNDFAQKLEDPLNVGSKGGDLIGVIEFDNTSFEVAKPNPEDVDYHPSFAYTIKTKINGIYQPTDFYQSSNVTNTYTKYNKKGPKVSTKENTKDFKKSNVTSSAGSIPKVAKVKTDVFEKAQKDVSNLAMQYNMNSQGFIGPNATGIGGLRTRLSEMGYGLKEAFYQGRLNGYYITKNNRKFNPFLNERAQKVFEKTDSPTQIVREARERNFSDAAISDYLQRVKKLKVGEIKKLLEVSPDLLTSIPAEFGKVEGGMKVGMEIYENVDNKLQEFAVENKKMADIREKAIDLLKNDPLFKQQPQVVKDELIVAFDRTLKTKANKNVQKQITDIKNKIKQNKITVKNINAAKIDVKNFIRRNLPKSKQYSQDKINKLIKIISDATVNTYPADVQRVLDIVEKQNAIIKKSLIKEMLALVKKGARKLIASGKPKARGLDASGQQFFKDVKEILVAAANNDVEKMIALANELSDVNAIDEVILKESKGEKLTSKEESLLNKVLAFDTFGDVMNMDVEQLTNLINDLKNVKKQSILNLKSRRLMRAKKYSLLGEKVTSEIKENYPMLFDSDGNLKNQNTLNQEQRQIWKAFSNLKFWDAAKKYYNRFNFQTVTGLYDWARGLLAHVGTLTNLVDNVSKGNTFFFDNIYMKLNDMNTNDIQGFENQIKKLDDVANTIPGITKGYTQFLNKHLPNGIINLNIRGQKNIYNRDELLRIYSLSKNEVQNQKLKQMGFDDAKLKEIEQILGVEATTFADNIINYLSNEYFESVNDVYKQVNDASLGYVNNYFPTKTLGKPNSKLLEDGDFSGVFTAETAPALKERTDTKADIDLGPSFTNTLNNHLKTMEKFKAYAEGVRTMNSIMNTPAVNTLLQQTGTLPMLKRSINAAINPSAGQVLSPTVLDKLMSRFTEFALSFKVVQIAKQSTSFVNAFEDYSFRLPGKTKIPGLDTLGFMVGLAEVVLTLPLQVKKAYNVSPDFRQRLREGLQGDVYGLVSGVNQFKSLSSRRGKLGSLVRGFRAAAASPTIIGDVLGVMGYMINYNQNIRNGMPKAEALQAFNMYNATQQTRRGTERSPIQNARSPLVRSFTMFGSTLFLQMNKVASSFGNIMKTLNNKKIPKSKDVRALVINYAVANVLFTTVANIAKFIDGDREDEEDALKKIGEAAAGLNLIYQVPLIGSALETMMNSITGNRGYSQDIVNPFTNVWRKMSKAIKTGSVVKAVQPLIEIVIGAQADPFIGLYNFFASEGNEKDNIYDILGISPSYRPDDKKKKSTKKPSTKNNFRRKPTNKTTQKKKETVKKRNNFRKK